MEEYHQKLPSLNEQKRAESDIFLEITEIAFVLLCSSNCEINFAYATHSWKIIFCVLYQQLLVININELALISKMDSLQKNKSSLTEK